MNYNEALNYISSVNWKGVRPGLERISLLLEKMGNPQKNLKFVHIGGTNGKGSTSAFISNVLRCSGYKTGLFISPFIETFNERMQINNMSITNDELAEITNYVKTFADTMADAPTEFELNTAIAFEYFKRNNCDIVVLEVGMGGEFDATNVIDSPEVVVITAIGLDHTAYLGDTVEKIAATKSGIIKEGCDVVLYKQSDSITEIIKRRCECIGAFIHISEPELLKKIQAGIDGQTFVSPKYGELKISLAASYQKNNLAAALKAIEALADRGYLISNENIIKGLKETTWPGRFEILNQKPVFLVDGAHNPHGIRAAVESLKAVFADKKLILIFGVLADKDYEDMLDQILPLAKTVLCVAPENSRALKASDLAEIVNKRGINANAFDSIEEAVDEAFSVASESDVICAVGSLYMIGDIKTYIKQR